MTPQQQHLARAAALDASIQAQDKLLLLGMVQHVHPKLRQRAVQVRDALTHEWAAHWATKNVADA